ncbi:hypothetical protein DIE23_33215 [Burkholderia sp. Bp9143]|uniref:cellulose biosynthesis protein BcsP n=1 Tax=Burkholderia sp. Bp9143 TaxID=2184574 RepID=UPI000F5A966B|nr:cellulose biosynthesis protein BcsP [Burkholderia sp. Bp9143]RQR24885.1 hypothetical protein DIE23_33215 [Burkholderia sp. Bp9143]
MSTSRDIESLFKRFGGDAGRYQEVRAEADAEAARARWPLLEGVELRECEPHAQPGSGAPKGAPGLRDILMADTQAAPPPAAVRRDLTQGPLKKLVGKRSASDATDARGSSQPLVRLFERLRSEAPGEGHDEPSTRTGRS